MANHVSHAALPYPIKGARYTVMIPYLDADGDPTDPTTPDTERSIDAAAFADCAEEMTTITGSNGIGYITLTGAETDCSILALAAKVASGPKATLATLYPRVLPTIESGTAQAGAAGTITLTAGAATFDLTGCIVKTTGGTGGGGAGGLSNQARVITAYNTSTKVATVVPNWETTPSSDTTYVILMTETAVNALNVPTVEEVDVYLSGIHGSGIWEDIAVDIPTTEEIDTYLSGIHGSGSWETADISSIVVPTVEEIDVYLSGLHGSGVWEDTIVDVPTVEEIDIYLSGLHGSGIWEDTIVDVPTVEEIDIYLSGLHGSGIWEDTIVDVPTVSEIDDYLSGIHGSGTWEDSETSAPTVSEIEDYLSGIHGSGNWETGDFPTPSEIDALLASNHGSGPWGGGSTGSNVVTITTENDDSDILGGVVVEVRSSGGSILIDRKYSNTSTGQLAFNLDDGQYELYTFQTGTVSFNNPYYFDVDDDEDITLTGTPIATPVPGTGDLVRVYAYVNDLGINPQLGVELIVKPSGNGYVDGDFVFSKGGLTALSDADGYVYLDIIGSTPVEIKVPKAGFEYFTVTPASGVLDIADLS